MAAFVESAAALMSNAARRLDIAAHNVANVSTPGYKRRIAFNDIAQTVSVDDRAVPNITDIRIMDQGKTSRTDNPFDLAIDGSGLFALRDGDAMVYSRQGQFARSADGLLVTPQGYVLQQAGGGDLLAEDGAVFTADGTLTVGDRPLGRLAIVAPADAAALQPVGESFFAAAGGIAMDEVPGATVRSGMVEASNVELADEMTQTMLALRQAESGARLIQIYDDLIGRAATAFAQGGGR